MKTIMDVHSEKIMADPNSGCWLWVGDWDGGQGYGRALYQGKTLKAHRVSYAITNGVLPEPKMKVMHKCDTPACVNPDHLKLGTQADNVRDCVAKRRRREHRHPEELFGEASVKAKISECIAHKVIAEIIRCPEKIDRLIAMDFGIPRQIVSRIRRGNTWRHILPSPWPVSETKKRGRRA